MATRIFGEIEGIPEGSTFENRQALHDSGVHRPTQAGISGSGTEGADSIVVSGGYADDEDSGDVIIYTGHGGNDSNTRRQVADQELTVGNLGLAISCDRGLPVRVIRGSAGDRTTSPASGYRYDGLYRVESYWPDTGRDGFRIWRFRLEKLESELERHPEAEGEPDDVSDQNAPLPRRASTTIQRIVRNSTHSAKVKALHDDFCQICGTRLTTPSGAYSEGAHIRPLGRPHDGPDDESNILCLCPNHHVQLDRLAIYIDEADNIVDAVTGETIATLRRHRKHRISDRHLEYHRSLAKKATD